MAIWRKLIMIKAARIILIVFTLILVLVACSKDEAVPDAPDVIPSPEQTDTTQPILQEPAQSAEDPIIDMSIKELGSAYIILMVLILPM